MYALGSSTRIRQRGGSGLGAVTIGLAFVALLGCAAGSKSSAGGTGGTSATTTTTTTPPPAEPLAACKASLDRVVERNLTFQPRQVMRVGEETTVEAALSEPNVPVPPLTGPPTTVVSVPTTCNVQATLSGPFFKIDPATPQTLSFVTTPTITFRWGVTPQRSGSNLALTLTISSVVELNGTSLVSAPDARSENITVAAIPVPFPTHLHHIIADPAVATLIALAALIVGGIPLVRVHRRRKAAKSTTPKGQGA